MKYKRLYFDSGQRAWMDMTEDQVVLSWPGGLVVLNYDDDMETLMLTVRRAVDDLMLVRPALKEVRDAKRKSYDEGWNAGWKARKDAEDREGSGDRGAVRAAH